MTMINPIHVRVWDAIGEIVYLASGKNVRKEEVEIEVVEWQRIEEIDMYAYKCIAHYYDPMGEDDHHNQFTKWFHVLTTTNTFHSETYVTQVAESAFDKPLKQTMQNQIEAEFGVLIDTKETGNLSV